MTADICLTKLIFTTLHHYAVLLENITRKNQKSSETHMICWNRIIILKVEPKGLQTLSKTRR